MSIAVSRPFHRDDWNLGLSQSVCVVVVIVQSLSHVQLFVTPWAAAHQAPLSLTISRSLLKLMSIESVMPSNYLILCHPLFLLPSIFQSIRVSSRESALLIRWPKYWSFSISPIHALDDSNRHSARKKKKKKTSCLNRWLLTGYNIYWHILKDRGTFFLKIHLTQTFLAPDFSSVWYSLISYWTLFYAAQTSADLLNKLWL